MIESQSLTGPAFGRGRVNQSGGVGRGKPAPSSASFGVALEPGLLAFWACTGVRAKPIAMLAVTRRMVLLMLMTWSPLEVIAAFKYWSQPSLNRFNWT